MPSPLGDLGGRDPPLGVALAWSSDVGHGMSRDRPYCSGDRSAPGPLNAARGVLIVIVFAILVGHVTRPSAIEIDPSTLTLLFLASILVLAPALKSAKLPGAEFNFREEIQAAEELGEQVHARVERELTDGPELTEGPELGWPGLFHLDDELRQLAIERPALALSSLRHEMAKGLRSTIRALSANKVNPSSLEEMVSYIVASKRLWPEQAVLLKVVLDISENTLMSGDVSAADSSTGATTKDLMRRLGHASPAAANRYLHAVDGRDAQIASALSELAAHGDAARLPKSIVVKH